MAKSKTTKSSGSVVSAPATSGTFTLFGSAQSLDPNLSSLFSSSAGPVTKEDIPPRSKHSRVNIETQQFADNGADQLEEDDDETPQVKRKKLTRDTMQQNSQEEITKPVKDSGKSLDEAAPLPSQTTSRSKKRRLEDDNVEAVYMHRLAREEAKEEAKRENERASKRQKQQDVLRPAKVAEENKVVRNKKPMIEAVNENSVEVENEIDAHHEAEQAEDEGMEDIEDDNEDTMSDADIIGTDNINGDEDEPYTIPKHESLTTTNPASSGNADYEKASRTVFLGNVSNSAITSKSARATLLNHLSSIFAESATTKTDKPDTKTASTSEPPTKDHPPKIESLRFRSTAFSTTIPRKAAFARATETLMPATTSATNAYCVYSTSKHARLAALKLNGTVILGRHLRVDSVAHPAKVDHRRCVFVGNLGFVDDESAVLQAAAEAAEADGRKKQKVRSKPAADTEEGLWQQFGKAGAVESVRVVRDSKTRVGKGFAYVQFVDSNAVEAALLFNDKRFPPLLPRKLRVVRAKRPMKRSEIAAAGMADARNGGNNASRDRRDPQAKSQLGRASKLFGRAGGAATLRDTRRQVQGLGVNRIQGLGMNGIRKPESFVFEGHRASSKQGGGGVKSTKAGGNGKKKGGKPRTRSAQRGAAWKKTGGAGKGSK